MPARAAADAGADRPDAHCHRLHLLPPALGLARVLLDAGFNVQRVYADSFSGEEKEDFAYLQRTYPELALYPTVHAKMRFLANKEPSDFLALGQKAAYFTNTNHFVNLVDSGGMMGYQTVWLTARLMRQAAREEQDMRQLVQIKDWGVKAAYEQTARIISTYSATPSACAPPCSSWAA